MSLSMITLTGTYLTETGAPAAGTVTLTPSLSLLVDPVNELNYELVPTKVALDVNGQFNISIPSTSQPTAVGTFNYSVLVQIAGQAIAQFSISPTTSGDISVLTPTVLLATSVTDVGTETTRAEGVEAGLQNQVNALGSGLTAASIVYPESYGAKGDGTTDDTTAIVTALATGKIVMCQATYRVTSKLVLSAGAWIHLRYRTSRIIGDFSGSQLIETANINTPTKVNDVRITGPGSIGRKTTAQTGDILHIYGDRFVCLQTQITTWGGGRVFYGGGDHHFTFMVGASINDGQVGTGGWRYVVGSFSKMTYMDINSGDDALQFVPGANSNDPLWNGSISHCWYECCTGSSAIARFMAVVISSSTNPGAMTCSITHSGFRDCHGSGGQRLVYVYNKDSNAPLAIYDILFSGCSVDGAASISQPEDVSVRVDQSVLGSSTGIVRKITFEDFVVTNPAGSASVFHVQGPVENCNLTRPILTAKVGATNAVVAVETAVSTRIHEGIIDCAGVSIAAVIGGVGGGANQTTDLNVVGTRVINLAASITAFNYNDVTGGKIRDTRVEPASGAASTAKAWRTGSSTTGLRVRDNDFSLLTGSPIYSDSGSGTQHSGNLGMGD